ncbi:MAG TPA: PQQ-dependent sugar dehydrogenase, partial [Flavobacteriales bacterium]
MRHSLQPLVVLLFLLVIPRSQAHVIPEGFGDALVMGGWNRPVGCTWDANGRMYVWEKRGRVHIVENGVRLSTPLVNIEQEVGNWGDHGLLGFALDPNFTTNGYIYLLYALDRHHLFHFGQPDYDPFATEGNAASIVRITRYTAGAPNFNTVDPASRLVLLGETASTGVPITFNTHGAGSLVFGRDGTLMASVGDGASAVGTDVGSASDSYYVQALADGILRPEENVGAWRAQMVNSLNGKILRLDPATGDGIPSNPWYDAASPRAPRSRVWALGFRNPYRMRLAPNTGSTDPGAGDPGTLYITDVGWSSWEELSQCDGPGMNFGWPQYEGLEASPYGPLLVENRDVPNPAYDGINCTVQFLRFQDLLLQASPSHANGHPSPCAPAQQLPNTVPKFFHARPMIDWKHGNQSRSGGFNGNTAVTFDLDAPDAPVPGPRFGGYAGMVGPSSDELVLPPAFAENLFFGDYVGGFIKRIVMDHHEGPVSVHDFADGLGALNFIGADPDGCIVYIKYNSNEIRRICYTLSIDLPPVVVATPDVQYGPSPLAVSFSGSGSSDPENGPLTFHWDFGDGSPHSELADPTHVFEAPAGVPTLFTVELSVSDQGGNTVTKELIVSVNNTPPVASITGFDDHAFYPVGVDTTFQLAADVTDAEHDATQISHAW